MIGNRSAIFIGSLSQMPPAVFTQMNISEASRNTWGPNTGAQAQGVDTQAAYNEWRDKLKDGPFSAQISALEGWLKQNFDITLTSLRFAPRSETSFMPSSDASLLMAQAASPDGSGTWTVLAAPTGKDLRDNMQALSGHANWEQACRRISTYEAGTKTVQTVPVNSFQFVPTQPGSFFNYRLIAANWLSTNILSYAVLLAVLAVILGLATATMLGNLGRRK